MAVLASVAILTAPLTTERALQTEAEELQAQREELNVQLAALGTNLRALKTRATEAFQQLERAKALRSKRSWSGMLVTIGKRMPSGCWLTSISTDPSAPTRGGPRPDTLSRPRGSRQEEASTLVIDAPRKLRITGYAATAAEPHAFAAGLKNTGIFSIVELERMVREPVLGGFYFRFELLCEW